MFARKRRRLAPEGLEAECLVASEEDGSISVRARTTAVRVGCPECGAPCSRVHSRYTRTIADLPWRGLVVTLKVRVRKFFCDARSCERAIFCERLLEVPAYARKTGRLEEALLAIVLELGGRAGVRLAAELGLIVGRDALLLRVKKSTYRANAENVRVLGVDDFAFRKVNTYGTVLVDLERRRVVDLLTECSQDSLASWLQKHPGVEVATRDRSKVYREGIAKGAPQAAQVADRWHLLRGLLRRWNEGCRNGKRLLEEIRGRGYSNSERTFIRFTGELRRAEAAGQPQSSAPRARKGSVAGLSPTAKNVAALFMRREEKLSTEQKEYLGRLCEADGELADARRLTQDFAGMVRDLEREKLDGWLAEAEASEAEVMRKFAAGLKKDISAVRAGLTERWSNGPVEGFVHKLELVKRQGYRRAGFDLLRARVLAA